MSLARHIMSYEKVLFKHWMSTIDAQAMSYLKLPILVRLQVGGLIGVNFAAGLVKLMRETRYLDRMGFEIPEIALNVTLQEESYHRCVSQLRVHVVDVLQPAAASAWRAAAAARRACGSAAPCCEAACDADLRRTLRAGAWRAWSACCTGTTRWWTR